MGFRHIPPHYRQDEHIGVQGMSVEEDVGPSQQQNSMAPAKDVHAILSEFSWMSLTHAYRQFGMSVCNSHYKVACNSAASEVHAKLCSVSR